MSSENDDMLMDDAPPLPTQHQQQQQRARPLSQTTWSRRHWLLLDELLQLRRRQPFPAACTRPRTADHDLLGKTVRSHGQSMTLQRWHLDCVDAFNGHVGGWDEGVLAKRLVALIMAEQRRGRGRGGQRRRMNNDDDVMFH
ncbi:hypothetical protein E4U41_006698 [Claviceps citrina]|nr:hypothetical protein E4U41_006698 [Claviceps citrina]